jgi:hypothetical protein
VPLSFGCPRYQRDILEQNNLADDQYFLDIAKKAVESYAAGSVRSPTELIVGFGPAGTIEMGSSAIEPLQAAISQRQERKLRDVFHCHFVDKVAVKGRSNAVAIFGVHRDVVPGREKAFKFFHAGIGHFYERRFDEALSNFNMALGLQPDDAKINRFRNRCAEFIKTPPPPDWNGVVVLHEK